MNKTKLTALALLISLTACGGGGGSGDDAKTPEPTKPTPSIPATNSPATFSGELVAEVNLANGIASGKATVVDQDQGQSTFQTSAAAEFGSFSISKAGYWTYKLNTAHPNFSSWNSALDSATDTIILTSADGTTTKLVITINGVERAKELIYLNEQRLTLAKQAVEANEKQYVDAYNELIKDADKELTKAIDPVTKKTKLPASGDKHDYYSLSPYWFPNPDTADGLPWLRKDGVYNKMADSSDFDFTRLKAMFASLDTLALAFYFSEDEKYLIKAKEIIEAWFINEDTKMNPNVNYGQGVPGQNEGRKFGIIEFTSIGKVMTAVQLLAKNDMWSATNNQIMHKWLTDYYTWLTTSELGIDEGNTTNNHASNYDYQLVGIMLFLDKNDEASAVVEGAQTKRVATQIEPDGSQPHELARTKSVNYTVNNLWALTRLADLGKRFTDTNLWSYQGSNGSSLQKGFEFVLPYMKGEKIWTWEQIIPDKIDGTTASNLERAEFQLANLALPMFSRTELMLGEKFLPNDLDGTNEFSAQEILIYAPGK